MPPDLPIIHTVIVAAGVGKRFGSDKPKQYTRIGAQTVLQHSVAALSQVPSLSDCYLVISAADDIAKTLNYAMPIQWVIGGQERMHSVYNAVTTIWQAQLDSGAQADSQWVLIHDAARPCVKAADIEKLIAKTTQQSAKDAAGGLLAVPVRDTVKQIAQLQNTVVAQQTLDRNQLWLAQTPQIFPLAKLYEYLTQAIAQHIPFTDEASLFEHFGEQPVLVEGSHSNIKLTFPEDLLFAEVFLANDE